VDILGREDVHGPLEAQWAFGKTFTEEQLAAFRKLPFSHRTLEECRESHLLIAGCPLSIMDIFRKHRRQFAPHFAPQHYDDQFARKQKVAARWYLLRKEAVPGSLGLHCPAQYALLNRQTEQVPLSCEVLYACILHALTTGEHLYPGTIVRCRDFIQFNERDERLGGWYINNKGFDLEDDGIWPEGAAEFIGLASERKPGV
jgi:hypothetical protein